MQTINGTLIASCLVVPTDKPEYPARMRFARQFGFTGKLSRPEGWSPVGYIILEVGPAVIDPSTDTLCVQPVSFFNNETGGPSPLFPGTMVPTNTSFAGFAEPGPGPVQNAKFMIQMTASPSAMEPPFDFQLADVPFIVTVFRSPNVGVPAIFG